MLKIVNHEGNANQNHNEMSPLTCQNEHHKKTSNRCCLRCEEKENSCVLSSGILNWHKHYGKQYGVSIEIKNRTTIWFSNFISEYLPKEIKNTNSKRDMHPYIYCRIIYNSQDTEATQGSIPWINGLKKQNITQTYKKNEIFSPETTQMDLEGIMLSEISQTGKMDIFHMITLIRGT